MRVGSLMQLSFPWEEHGVRQEEGWGRKRGQGRKRGDKNAAPTRFFFVLIFFTLLAGNELRIESTIKNDSVTFFFLLDVVAFCCCCGLKATTIPSFDENGKNRIIVKFIAWQKRSRAFAQLMREKKSFFLRFLFIAGNNSCSLLKTMGMH